MATAKESKELYATLAKLGGKQDSEEDIQYAGTKLIIPEQFRGKDLSEVAKFIEKVNKDQNSQVQFTANFNYRPWDGAYNAYQAIKKMFGMVQAKPQPGFFGPKPPQFIQVPINKDETVEVPWGDFAVPLLEDSTIRFGASMSDEYGQIFNITITGPRRHRFVVQGLFEVVRKELSEFSIYMGKAIDGANMPHFIDLSGVDPSKVVYSRSAKVQLENELWSYIDWPEETKKALGMPSKRAVLLEGTFGTGKTLTANTTALKAVANGMTFIQARAGQDNFFEVMQTARLYQGNKGAIVFLEDADTLVTNGGDGEELSRLLDVFDGIQSKATKIMVVMTTNHPDVLTQGMRRPGRIDRTIKIGLLDDEGVEALTRIVVGNMLDPEVDFTQVCAAMEGYPPAFIKESLDSSKRYAATRNDGVLAGLTITTDDIVFSAEGMRDQFVWMKGEVEVESLSLENAMDARIKKSLAVLAAPKDYRDGSVWNEDALTNLQPNVN